MISLLAGPPARALLCIAGWVACAATAILLPVGSALAFSTPEAFGEPAALGGAGGRWFTGSPAEGYDCTVCHEPAPAQLTYPFYLSGLQTLTYSLDTQQEYVIAWPQFAASYTALNAALEAGTAAPGADIPMMGLVVEFVAESGGASGTIEIDTAEGLVQPGETCVQQAANLRAQHAAKLFRVRPGLGAEPVRPDDDGVLRCEASQLGQRCLIAMRSCGASQVRFRWETPDAWQGPIWFSAGFVATESISGSFDGDSVFMLNLPLEPAEQVDGPYVKKLSGGCALAAPRSTSTGGWMLACTAMALLWLSRRAHRGGRT